MVEKWKENVDNNVILGIVLTDLSKAFDCLPHDLMIAKPSAFELDSDSLCYIYFYLKYRKQCVQINDEQRELDTIISGVPKAQFSDQFHLIFFSTNFFISKASVHNFANDNTLANSASTLKELLPVLKSECEAAINWLHNNKIIVNLEKFQVILLVKRGSDNIKIEVKIGNRKLSRHRKLSLSEFILTIN